MAWQIVMRYGRSFGTGFVVGLPIYITLTDYGYCIARVDGISMQPSLNPEGNKSDVVLIDRWTSKDVFNIKRGDVVSLTSPSDPDIKLIKRVIGLEGDVVKTLGYKKRYVSVPKGHCWLEGDHRGRSLDSNKFGPVSLGLVNGIATRIVWPPNRWMKITRTVNSDRIPLKRSFSQCALSEMLKKPDAQRTDLGFNAASDAGSGSKGNITLKGQPLLNSTDVRGQDGNLPAMQTSLSESSGTADSLEAVNKESSEKINNSDFEIAASSEEDVFRIEILSGETKNVVAADT